MREERRRAGRPRKLWQPDDPNKPVMLRIRMRKGLLDKIKAIAEYERALYEERTWNMSDSCREVLFEWVQRRYAEIRIVQQAQFSGAAPSFDPSIGAAPDDDEGERRMAAKN